MEQPFELVVNGGMAKSVICKSNFMGLRQSPRAWLGRFGSVIQEFGLCHSQKDHSVSFAFIGKNIFS